MFNNTNGNSGAGGSGSKDYRQVALNDFSSSSSDDDDDDDEHGKNRNGRRNANADSSNNSSGSNNRQQRQQELMQAQDAGLEMLGVQAERLGQLSLQIGDELTAQNRVLSEMDDDLGTAHTDLELVTRKTQQFLLEQAGGAGNLCIVLVLCVVVVVLILLILYT
jgi:syntaxin of plants SYP6